MTSKNNGKSQNILHKFELTLDISLLMIIGISFLRFVFPVFRMIIEQSGKKLPELSVIAFRICFFFNQHLYYLFLAIVSVGFIEFVRERELHNTTKLITKLIICIFYVYILFTLSMPFFSYINNRN